MSTPNLIMASGAATGKDGKTGDDGPDLLAQLGDCEGIMVKQSISLTEMVTGFDTANKYRVIRWDPKAGEESVSAGMRGDLTLGVEESDCCHRQLCGTRRGFDMKFIKPGYAPEAGNQGLWLQRPFQCCVNFFCLNRDRIYIMYGDYALAEVVCPFTCCNWNFTVSAPKSASERGVEVHPSVKHLGDQDWYTLDASCLQLSALCPMPCGPCSRYRFVIKDFTSDQEVGHLTKVTGGFCKALLTDANDFVAEFPAGASPAQKAALLAASVLIDFILFEGQRPGE